MDFFYFFKAFAEWFVYDFLVVSNEHLAGAAIFFIYDTLKILFLIIFITHFMSFFRFYLPIEKLRNFLSSRRFFGLDYFLATIFGAITPFCSCSSIPLFIGFIEAHIPLGVTFAFLITSPLVNEIAIGLFIGMFGIRVTLIYILAGILVGMAGGFIIGKLRLEKYVADFIWKIQSKDINKNENKKIPFRKIFKTVSSEAFGITKKIIPYIIIGIGIGGFIHGYVPEGFFELYLQKAGAWGVPLAVFLGVPLYSNASGVIPIVHSLITKGVPIGTGLAFMMAVVGLSLPEAVILKRVLKWQLLLIFFTAVTVGIIIIGYLFNIIL